MTIDTKGSLGDLMVLWNLLEVVFQDQMACSMILIGNFRYLGSKEKVSLMAVYGPHMSVEKVKFLGNMK